MTTILINKDYHPTPSPQKMHAYYIVQVKLTACLDAAPIVCDDFLIVALFHTHRNCPSRASLPLKLSSFGNALYRFVLLVQH